MRRHFRFLLVMQFQGIESKASVYRLKMIPLHKLMVSSNEYCQPQLWQINSVTNIHSNKHEMMVTSNNNIANP